MFKKDSVLQIRSCFLKSEISNKIFFFQKYFFSSFTVPQIRGRGGPDGALRPGPLRVQGRLRGDGEQRGRPGGPGGGDVPLPVRHRLRQASPRRQLPWEVEGHRQQRQALPRHAHAVRQVGFPPGFFLRKKILLLGFQVLF